MRFRRVSLVLGAIFVPVLISIAGRAQAPVKIGFSCKVPGYSSGSGWVRIDEGSRSGGRVIRTSSEMVTDRVARGETLRVVIDDPSFTKKCKCSFILEAKVLMVRSFFVAVKQIALPGECTPLAKNPAV